jgi:hypothetical protein
MQIIRRTRHPAVGSIHVPPDDTNELGAEFLVEPPDHISFGRF